MIRVMHRRRACVLALALAVASWTPGCGGGTAGPGLGPVQGGTPAEPSVLFFLGDYRAIAHWCGPDEAGSYSGHLQADGAGRLFWGSTIENDNSAVFAGNPGQDEYTVAPSGELGWNPREPDALRGGLPTDGSVALAASSASGVSPEIRIAVRLTVRGSGRSTPQLPQGSSSMV